MNDNIEIGKKFRKYLVDKDLSVKQFAELIGKGAGYISRISKGAIQPGRKTSKDIELATGGLIKFKYGDGLNVDYVKCKGEFEPRPFAIKEFENYIDRKKQECYQ